MTYSPNLGRWLQVDPTGFDGGDANLYRFVGNNPTNAVDPTGLSLIIDGHEIKDAADPMYNKILGPILEDKVLKSELDAAIEILDKMIKPSVEKKKYSYKTIDDMRKELKLRLYMVVAAKQWAKAAREGRLTFPKDETPISFTGSSDIVPTKVKMVVGGLERELTGIGLKGGTPSKAIDAMIKAKKENTVVADCASTVGLVIQTALWMYLGDTEYDKLFNRDKPFVIAGPLYWFSVNWKFAFGSLACIQDEVDPWSRCSVSGLAV